MRDYNKSKIYKLVTNHTTDVYYGSTINPLYLRLSGHKGAYNRWINGMGKYMSSFEIIKYGDAKIILVEEFPCENKHQLERMEREYIELNDCVNKNIPTRESTCEHNRERYKCKECGGKGICEHNRERSYCKECGGIGICKHNRQRSQCKECMGSAICKHNKQRSTCKECGGSAVCVHNRQRSQCKECGGSCICKHNRQRSQCKECRGSNICNHNRVRGSCRECNGVLVQPTQCILCNNTVRKDYLTRHINTVHADSDFFNKSNTTYEYATDSDDEFIT